MREDKLTLEEVFNLELPPVILYAIPIMLTLTFGELVIRAWRQRKKFDGKDYLASASIGIGNLISSAAVKALMFGFILFFYNLVPWTIPATWWSYILCLVVFDFFRYWAHRVAHEQRFWWATHVPHHSSTEYNFSVSYRLSWVQHIKIVFFIPVALCGFHPIVFFVVHQVEVLYQFWIHTELIKKLPKPIEFIFTTPSHHRVHHAVNEKYIDKNYGSTFIIWDRIFGTFQPEEEPAIYGITKPVNSYNPIHLVFHECIDIVKDLRYARSFSEARKVIFSPPGKYEPPAKQVKDQSKVAA